MNLALIDPFQLAQDYPDVLIDDLSKYKAGAIRTDALTCCAQNPAMLPLFASTAKAIISPPAEQMARLLSGMYYLKRTRFRTDPRDP